jgi:hypothetical protein
MIKNSIAIAAGLLAAAITATAASETNVLQNISIALTVYQQGATNANGRSVADKVSSFNTKDLIAALGTVTDQEFGNNAKLVQATTYSNIIVTTGPGVFSNYFSTNLPVTTNNLTVMIGTMIINLDTNAATISSNQLNGNVTINSGVISILGNTNEHVTINTNAGFITTLTPQLNLSSTITNLAVLTQEQVTPPKTESVLTNVSTSIDVLYGPKNQALFPVTGYVSFSQTSPQVVVETGVSLNTTNGGVASQTAYNIGGAQINYAGQSNLTMTLQGFVKQSLKVDVMSRSPLVAEDIYGAGETWNVNGSGYVGGFYTTNATSVPIMGGYLTNATPIVVEGSITFGFLENLAQ